LPTYAQMIIQWFDQGRLRSIEAGNFFFQPLEFHFEPADLLVEFGLDRLALVVVAAASVAEQRFDAVQELLLPLTDLDGVDLIRPDSSARVLVCLAASRATRALKDAGYRFRVPFMMRLGMQQ
jgi:hypothetical protein